MSEARGGVLALIAACIIWGLSPLFYKLLANVDPLTILAHRTVWSMVFFVGVLVLQGRLRLLVAAILTPRLAATLALASFFIACNWFLFILSIQIGRATESSLGYYIFPLVAVLLGYVFLGERLSRAQGISVALAAAAVLMLAVGLGIVPWISLVLSTTFGLYGLIKKQMQLGPVVSVTGEVLLLAPLALGVLFWQSRYVEGAQIWGQGALDVSLLILSGPLTALPLILFSLASKRISMATVGLVQYINPTLQFLCAVVIFGEPFGTVHLAAFAMIWAALAIYSAASFNQERARRKALINSG